MCHCERWAGALALSAELLVPANRNSGSTLGVVTEVHLYLDDIFPQTLGTPVTQWCH